MACTTDDFTSAGPRAVRSRHAAGYAAESLRASLRFSDRRGAHLLRAAMIGPEEITDKQRVQSARRRFTAAIIRFTSTRILSLASKTSAVNSSGHFCTRIRSITPSSRASGTCAWITRLAYLPPLTPGFGPAERAIYEERDCPGLGLLPRVDRPAARRGPRNSRRHLAHRSDVACQARAKSGPAGGEARDRSRALRIARRRGDDHGAHAFRHRAASPVAHGRGSDTPAEARAVIGEMVGRVREIDPAVLRPLR